MLGRMASDGPQMTPPPPAEPQAPAAEEVSERLTRFQEGLLRGDFRELSELIRENIHQPDPILQRFLARKRLDFRIDPVALWIFVIGGLCWVGIAAISLFH
jgi:hypothetical protein